MNNIIAVKNLTKIYKIYNKPLDRLKETFSFNCKKYSNDFYALNNVTFNIKKGETVGIVGKNGAGKSTLLKIITGVLTPTCGEVNVDGKIASLLELGAGFNPEMTGIENIYMSAMVMGFDKKEIKNKLQDILLFADIGDFIYQPVKTYSSGMFARLAFAVNVNVCPDILIVDEALSVGDVFFQQKCIHKMKNMQKNGTTIFFVSHSLGTIKSLCSKVMYLKAGEIVAIGKPENVCNLYQNELVDYKETSSEVVSNKDESQPIYINNISNIKYFKQDKDFYKKITEHSGSGEIELTSFDIYDTENRIITSSEIFKPIVLRLSHIVKKDIPAGASLGITCRTEMGIDVFGCNSNIYKTFLPELKKGEKFVCEIKLQVPLLAGRYFFHMGIKPNQLVAYWYERCFGIGYIDVYNNSDMDDVGIGGIIYVKPLKFEIHKE